MNKQTEYHNALQLGELGFADVSPLWSPRLHRDTLEFSQPKETTNEAKSGHWLWCLVYFPPTMGISLLP